MTKAELIDLLDNYTDDTVILIDKDGNLLHIEELVSDYIVTDDDREYFVKLIVG